MTSAAGARRLWPISQRCARSGTLEAVSKARYALILSLLPLALSMVACSSPSGVPSSASPSGSTASPTVVSKDLSGVTVTGDFGKTPKVTFKAGLYLAETTTKVIKASTGRKVPASGIVKVHYYGVNGRDGKVFDESFSTGSPVEFPTDGVITGFKKGLEGQTVGSRVLIGIPGKDGYDASGGSSDGSIAKGDTILFVVDIVDTSYEYATGQAVTPKAGLPTVAVEDNVPKITIPDSDPPSSLQVQTLIKGSGAKVTTSSTILVKYTGVSWKTKEVVEENWTTGESSALNSLIKGWQQGLSGQTVGSRVLLVIPPSLAYPTGQRKPKVEAGDTLVYVIDILYASSSS